MLLSRRTAFVHRLRINNASEESWHGSQAFAFHTDFYIETSQTGILYISLKGYWTSLRGEEFKMETSSMETEEIVVENQVAESAETDEVVPVEVSETRAKPPEIEKSPVQQVNILDLSKLSPEVQQGYRVFMEMSADSYKNVTWPFLEPVDAEALGLWDYHERIKEPMSFYQSK